MEFPIKIGGVTVKVIHSHRYIRRLCEEYVVSDSEPCEVTVMTTPDAIDTEKRLCAESYPDGVLEATCLHRALVRALVKYGIILMHAAVVAVDGQAYVFLAKSGVGKSTHVRLWKEVFGDRAVMVNGDKPFFSFEGDTLWAHGSPWKGKEGYGEPVSVPVGGICFLERGEHNGIKRASDADVVERLFHQVLLPTDAADMGVFMTMINRIWHAVPFYVLQCNRDKEAAEVAYRGMRKDDGR